MLRRLVSLTVTLLTLMGIAGSASAARPLHLGFFDGVYLENAPERSPWLHRTADVGSDIVRLEIGWPVSNPVTRPPGLDARNPSDPRYDFSRADAAVKDATAHGLDVLASFSSGPQWADAPGRPATARPGTWRPDPGALRDYGVALARRYSGSFPDPARPGRTLPRVKAFQVWNEPNLDAYLAPQWIGGHPAAPAHYRRMLNAFYQGVKSVRRSALVVTAGTAPFGDPGSGGHRMMPVHFVRELLCLRRGRRNTLRRLPCAEPARFDILSHHPYSVGAPSRRALNADDASLPDLGKLTRLMRVAERSGRLLPRKRHKLWVTEVSYDSSPPDPDGVPVARHARYLEEAFYLLWRQGVDTVTWYLIRDLLPSPSFSKSNQSGVFFRDGRPKPAATAFRFPLVARRARRGRIQIWGRSPSGGTVVIQRGSGPRWRTAKALRVRRHGVFTASIRATGAKSFRARIGGERSLVWRVR
jgi:hypothetical protein